MFRNLKSDWSLVPSTLCFLWFSPLKGSRFERKNKVNFLKSFDNFLSTCLILKRILARNGCFGLFTKIKKWSGTIFWCTFFAWFFHKNILYLIIYQWSKFQCHNVFSSQNIKPNLLLSSYLDSWWCHKL